MHAEDGSPLFNQKADSEIRKSIIQSLANIRTLHFGDVDKFILDRLESQDLYTQVANQVPDSNPSVFYSWAFEQLMFRVLTEYYEEFGADTIKAFREAAKANSAGRSAQVFVERLINKLGEIAQ
jgi:hypothetical protein